MLKLSFMLSTQGKIFSRPHFSYFFQKTGFDISCKLSHMETICMKCQSLFSWKNKKNITILSSAELAQRVVKVNGLVIKTQLQIRLYFQISFFFFQKNAVIPAEASEQVAVNHTDKICFWEQIREIFIWIPSLRLFLIRTFFFDIFSWKCVVGTLKLQCNGWKIWT